MHITFQGRPNDLWGPGQSKIEGPKMLLSHVSYISHMGAILPKFETQMCANNLNKYSTLHLQQHELVN